jgi:hypothetical protein
MWLFTATIVDGNFRQVFYTCLLLGYWGGIWLIPQRIFPHGRPLGWLLAVFGWLIPVGFGLWLFARYRG